MATLTGNEPISAANLKAVLEGVVPRHIELYRAPGSWELSTTYQLTEDASTCKTVYVFGENHSIDTTVTLYPSFGITSATYESGKQIEVRGSQLVFTDGANQGFRIGRIIGVK